VTDHIVTDADLGLADRLAIALPPWLFLPSQAAIERQHEATPELEAGL
jgi:hypothetical protein